MIDQLKTVVRKTLLYKYYRSAKTRRSTLIESKMHKALKQPFVEKYLPKKGIGAELGVYKGVFSSVLLEAAQTKKLHLIDPWYLLSAEWSWSDEPRSTIDALIKILKKFKKEIEAGRILVHVDDDLKVLATFPDKYLDWAYVDSSHAYEHTKAELLLLLDKVKNNGIIAGDDWFPDPENRHHGVYKAVNEFINTHDYELIYSSEDNRQWAMRKANIKQDSPDIK